jgi:hypothetical protein
MTITNDSQLVAMMTAAVDLKSRINSQNAQPSLALGLEVVCAHIRLSPHERDRSAKFPMMLGAGNWCAANWCALLHNKRRVELAEHGSPRDNEQALVVLPLEARGCEDDSAAVDWW